MNEPRASSLSRRMFLGGVVALAAAFVLGWRAGSRPRWTCRGIAALVRTRLAQLGITPNRVDEFAADQYELLRFQLTVSERSLLAAAGACAPLLTRFESPFAWSKSASSRVDELTRRYLLASDFFLEADTETQCATYLGPYHRRACANPFARERFS